MKKLLFLTLLLTVAFCNSAVAWQSNVTVTIDETLNSDSLDGHFPDFDVDKMADTAAIKAPLTKPVFLDTVWQTTVKPIMLGTVPIKDTLVARVRIKSLMVDTVGIVKAITSNANWTKQETFTTGNTTDTVKVTGLKTTSTCFVSWRGATAPTIPLTKTTVVDTIFVFCAAADTTKARAEGYDWFWTNQ